MAAQDQNPQERVKMLFQLFFAEMNNLLVECNVLSRIDKMTMMVITMTPVFALTDLICPPESPSIPQPLSEVDEKLMQRFP